MHKWSANCTSSIIPHPVALSYIDGNPTLWPDSTWQIAVVVRFHLGFAMQNMCCIEFIRNTDWSENNRTDSFANLSPPLSHICVNESTYVIVTLSAFFNIRLPTMPDDRSACIVLCAISLDIVHLKIFLSTVEDEEEDDEISWGKVRSSTHSFISTKELLRSLALIWLVQNIFNSLAMFLRINMSRDIIFWSLEPINKQAGVVWDKFDR